MKNKLLWAALSLIIPIWAGAQGTFPVNGVNNPQTTRYTFINANIQVSPQKLIYDGILEIENGKILLIPENEKYEPIPVNNPENFSIIGKVIGVFRSYN